MTPTQPNIRCRAMTHTRNSQTEPGRPEVYQVRIGGRLGPRWEGWFEGMIVSQETNGETLLTGPVVDQAALHGVLTRIRDLGLPLISIMRIEPRALDVATPVATSVTERMDSSRTTSGHAELKNCPDVHHGKDTK